MASLPKFPLLRAVAAIATTALLYAFGTGLHPLWILAWLAPIPCLVYSVRARWWTALLVSFLGAALGALNLWHYLGTLFPLLVRVAFLLPPGVLLALTVLAFRSLIRNGKLWTAWLVAPAAWVSLEWLVSRASPHGTFGNLAYSQLSFLPVLQIASLVGLWGISFLLVSVPSAVAILLTQRESAARTARAVALVSAGVLAIALLFGYVRLNTLRPVKTVPVGLLASDGPNVGVLSPGDASRELFRAYLREAEPLVRAGARLIVLPEKLGVVELDTDNTADAVFQSWSDQHKVAICVGVIGVEAGRAYNEARLYRPGASVLRYHKQRLLPGFESHFVPGKSLTAFEAEGAKWGLEICKDLDFTYPSRGYGTINANALLVPGWDFRDDWLLHGHMAVLRGVEFGFSIVRPAKGGSLYVSDPAGRIISEVQSNQAPFTSLLVDVPIYQEHTLYTRTGDWLPWLSLALLACGLGFILTDRRRPMVAA